MTVAEAEELIRKGKIFLQFVLYRLQVARHNLVEMHVDAVFGVDSEDATTAPLEREILSLDTIVERAQQLYGQDYVKACAPDGPIA